MSTRRPVIHICAVAVIAVTLLALYGSIDPSSGFYPRCLFRELTGFSCPGCGSQRALHALLHGHLSEAWRFNPMLFVMLPLCLFAAGLTLSGNRFARRLHAVLNSRSSSLLILTILIVWTIARNILLI